EGHFPRFPCAKTKGPHGDCATPSRWCWRPDYRALRRRTQPTTAVPSEPSRIAPGAGTVTAPPRLLTNSDVGLPVAPPKLYTRNSRVFAPDRKPELIVKSSMLV